MAEFFCEEVKKFDVDEFFGNLNTFLEKVIQCKKVKTIDWFSSSQLTVLE